MNHSIETAAHEIARAAHACRLLEAIAARKEYVALHEEIIHREFKRLADALGYDVKRREDDGRD